MFIFNMYVANIEFYDRKNNGAENPLRCFCKALQDQTRGQKVVMIYPSGEYPFALSVVAAAAGAVAVIALLGTAIVFKKKD